MSMAAEKIAVKAPPISGNHSKVIRKLEGFDWEGVPLEAYKADTAAWKGITRRELVGKRGETAKFHVRYFEIQPGEQKTHEVWFSFGAD